MKKTGTLRQTKKLVSLFEDTPSEQLQALLGSGLLADLRDANIDTIDRDSFRQFVGLKPLRPLLRKIGTITIPAIERFVTQEHFLINTDLKIGLFSKDFKEWFLEKIEEPASETKLCYAELTRWDSDTLIASEIGDAKETTLAQIHGLMKLQKPREQGGVLLTRSAPGFSLQSIFYVRDANGALRVVSIDGSWTDHWEIAAYSFPSRGEWPYGSRVFFPNP